MKKVLFCHSYFLSFDPKQWELQQPYPPLATIYAASLIRNIGFEVRLFDPMFSKDPGEISSHLDSFAPDFLVIYEDGFNYLTKMCLTNMREAALKMIRIAAERGINIMVSGSDSTDHPELYLDAGAGFIIAGEGERTLEQLLGALTENKDQYQINGLIYRQNGSIIRTPKRDVIKDLDELPAPAWDLIDINEYKTRWLKNHGYFSLNISTTRGCPFHCNWCAKPIYGNRYNVHSPARIAREMEFLSDQYGGDHFWITDDIFGLKPGWVQDFSIEVARTGRKFRYKIQSRVDLLLRSDTVDALAESGCDTVWMGAESGSQKILDAMDKGIRVSQISEATKLLREHGIKPAFFLQFGYPGETMDDIKLTLDMVLELLPDDIGISVSYPLPGTAFYEKVKNELKEKTNWTDSDEMAMMFRNTYPPAFYKYLQRFVHRHYRTRQGISEIKNLLKDPSHFTRDKFRRIAGVPVYFGSSLYYKSRMHASMKTEINHE